MFYDKISDLIIILIILYGLCQVKNHVIRLNLYNKSKNMKDIIKRLHFLFGTKKDSELASRLNIKQSAFSERKKRGSIPYKELIDLCQKNNINAHWLLTGQGDPFLASEGYESVYFGVQMLRRMSPENDKYLSDFIEILEFAQNDPQGKKMLVNFLSGMKEIVRRHSSSRKIKTIA